MPQKLLWTVSCDERLMRLRRAGKSWDVIAATLATSRNAAIERGRRLGARLPARVIAEQTEDPERPSLPPGHEISWSALVRGTVLADEPYPLYVEPGRRRSEAPPDCVSSAATVLPRIMAPHVTAKVGTISLVNRCRANCLAVCIDACRCTPLSARTTAGPANHPKENVS